MWHPAYYRSGTTGCSTGLYSTRDTRSLSTGDSQTSANTVNKLNSQWWAPLSQKQPSLLSNRACHGWIRCQSKCLVSVPDIPYVYKSRTYIQLNLLHMWLARFYAENLISFGPVHLQYLLYIVLYSVVILLVSAALPEAEKRQGYFKNSPKRLRLQFDVM